MANTHLGHQVLSVFGITLNPKALGQKAIHHNLLVSVVSAFFVVLLLGLFLGSVVDRTVPISAAPVSEAKTAFEPGQLVTKEISRGYLVDF